MLVRRRGKHLDKESLVQELKKKPDIDEFAVRVTEQTDLIPLLFEIIEDGTGSVKFTGEKVIRKISEEKPEILYPFFERMEKLTKSENSFIRWGFILSLPNMIRTDKNRKWKKAAFRFLSFLDSDSVVEFGNAVAGLPGILETYPQMEDDIVQKLLSIESHRFIHKGEVSPECINVAKGQILDCFDDIYYMSKYKKEMIVFAQSCLNNRRNGVVKKAKAFLKKHGKG